MASMSKLFLDDIRKPLDVKVAWHGGVFEEFPSLYSWDIVRSYADFTKYILTRGLPTLISFDHDLAWEHYPQKDVSLITTIDYSKFKEKTGYDCAKWLADYCVVNNLPLPDYMVHSFNPVGRTNIVQFLERFQEIRPDLKIQSA